MNEASTKARRLHSSGVIFILYKMAGDLQEPRTAYHLLPITFPQTPAVGVAVTSVSLALTAQGGRAGSEILWNKVKKIYRMPAGQGVPKRPNGSLCSDCTGKNFPWWLAVKSRIWLLMSSRVTHVINGTASWNLLESCKFLSRSLSRSLPPSFSSSLSHHFAFLFSPPSVSLTLSLFLRWWWTGVRKTAFLKICWGGRGSSSCDSHSHELRVILRNI